MVSGSDKKVPKGRPVPMVICVLSALRCKENRTSVQPQRKLALSRVAVFPKAGRAQDRGVALLRLFDSTLSQPSTSSEYAVRTGCKAPARQTVGLPLTKRDGPSRRLRRAIACRSRLAPSRRLRLALAKLLRLESGRGSAVKYTTTPTNPPRGKAFILARLGA